MVRGIPPDRLSKRHGRLRSESAKDGYVKDPLTERLSVSKNLGLYFNYLASEYDSVFCYMYISMCVKTIY